jgi:hypothetical protein
MGCITLDWHSTGMKVYVGDKATLVGTIGDGIVVNNWTTLEVRVVVGASGTIQVRMNGLVVFTFNGNTQPGTATTINNMVYYVVPMWNHGVGLASTYWDDLLINDALGSKFNSWPNGVRIHRRKMVSAGNYAQWTPQGAETNVACVNEDVPSMDTYVEPTAPGQRDSYVPEDAPEGLTGIAAVAFRYWGQGGGNIKRLCRLDGTDYLGGPLFLSGSFNHVDDFMYTKPGGGGWDVPTFNAMEAGMEGE